MRTLRMTLEEADELAADVAGRPDDADLDGWRGRRSRGRRGGGGWCAVMAA